MRDNWIGVCICILFVLFIATTSYINGYSNGIAHAINDTKIVQNGDVIRFYLDDQEWNFMLERR